MRKIVIAAMILGCFLTGCGIPESSAAGEPDTEASGREMLLDSFRRTVGTPMEMPYYELVIYTYDHEHLLLEEYADGGTDHETVKGYLIPHDAYESVLEIIRKHRMQEWGDKNLTAVTGVLHVCRFRLDGAYYRVSSENMPEDGLSAFFEVHSAMASYIDPEQMIYDRYTAEPSAGPEAGPAVVRDREELLPYLKTAGLDLSCWEEYFTLTSGMGSVNEDGSFSDHVLYYVLLHAKAGIFPYGDFRLRFACTAVRDGAESPEQGEAGKDIRWHYDPIGGCLWARPAVSDEFTVYQDLRVTETEGEAAWLELPEELVHEDAYGKFFYFGNTSTKYYLDGYTGHVIYGFPSDEPLASPPDYDDIWFDRIFGG